MIRLYSGGGSQEVDLLDLRMRPDVWLVRRNVVVRLLERRGAARAAELLATLPFEMWDATNGFGDEFSVLHAFLPLEAYVAVADMQGDPETLGHFRRIADALGEVSMAIRFIGADLDQSEEAVPVRPPAPAKASEVLERALAEVERSLAEGRPASGVDRVHTALHAYLQELAASSEIVTAPQSGIVELFGLLRQNHPALHANGPHGAEITRVLRALAKVIAELDSLRNNASLAHPAAEGLLPDAEAMLVINASRTLLHYLEKKIRP